jgi:6-phosphofructo-2-kinase / fructose-2,6-biphosphatase 4
MDPMEAAQLYLRRIETKIPVFETMDEPELNYIKMINAGQSFFYNNVNFSYISHRIVFYLTNLHIKSRTTFFVRAGTATQEDSYKADAPLSEEGQAYALKMTETLLKHREQDRQAIIDQGGPDIPLRPLTVWTSTRLRSIQTADFLKDKGFKVRQRSQMSQINPGMCEKMSERAIRTLYPDEVEKHDLDPYHHRYPRAEVRDVAFSASSSSSLNFLNHGDSLFLLNRCLLTPGSRSHTTIWLCGLSLSFSNSSVSKTIS